MESAQKAKSALVRASAARTCVDFLATDAATSGFFAVTPADVAVGVHFSATGSAPEVDPLTGRAVQRPWSRCPGDEGSAENPVPPERELMTTSLLSDCDRHEVPLHLGSLLAATGMTLSQSYSIPFCVCFE